jgi:hypothetical protein
MPVVPDSAFEQHVMPQGQAAYNTIDRATPGSFGGQVGQTLDQAGNQLMQHAVQRQQLANETAVQDIYANQFSPQARAIVQNYMKLEGKDAEAQFPAFEQKINDLRNQTRESLNPYQQKLFDARSTHRIEADLDGMARYGASQTKAWEWNTHNAVLGDLTAEAEANYNNPQRLQNIVERMDNETIDYGSKHGWSSDVFQYQRGQNQDKLWSAVIKRQALYDPAGAMKTYRDNVEMGRISGVAQGELDKFFKPIQELGQAQAAYGKATGGATAQAIAGEAARQGVDPSTALTIWSAEGGVTNPATPNARGSPALGIFQFMPDTWAAMGGTDRNRLDAARQVQLGIALTKQNSDALTKDLGRQPQPWEVYLAHQQGIEGATALIHADPNANAGDIVGNPKAITQNGGTPGMTVSQFINYIKGYVDRHSMMYAANGVPTAQNLTENYEAGLQAVTDLAREEHPGDPQAEERYRSYYLQQTGQQIHAEKMTNQANWNTVRASLTGPAPVKSWREFISDPRLLDAYNSIYKSDPSAYSLVDKAITTNAMSAWDPPATDETNQLYDNLNGMQCTNRDGFSSLNLMQYYGGMPVSQFNQLLSDQNKIRNHDATQATKLTNLNASINAVRDLRTLAAASSESPFYKMDFSSPLLPEQKWNEFVSRFGQALEDWRQNNNGKIQTDMQKREIAQEILFPNGMPGQQTSTEIHDLTNKLKRDDAGKPYPTGRNADKGPRLTDQDESRDSESTGSGIETPQALRENQNPFGLWVARQLQEAGKIVSDDTIKTAGEKLAKLHPDIEKDYRNINLEF